MKSFGLTILCLLFLIDASGQVGEVVKISFRTVYGNKAIILNDSSYMHEIDNLIKFESLKFYISNINLYQNESITYSEKYSFHLIDISDTSSQIILLNLPSGLDFDKIRFNLGIDSTTNVAGAMGGDLDPTKGMYWTWKSGYINFKMEGSCSQCPSSNRDFELHLGGYQYPFYALQQIELETHTKRNLNLCLDMKKFFSKIDLKKQKSIMSPSREAASISDQLAKCFRIE